MAPPNDLLADAEVVGKGYQTVSGTTVDAGWSDEGTAGYDQPSVWYRLDTTILQADCPFWVKVTPQTGYNIWGEVYSVNDPNPNAEDLLTGAVGTFMDGFGNGTDSVDTQLIDTDAGDVGSGMYYFVYVGNYDFDGSTGTFDIEFGVPWSVSATTDPNTASSTVTVLADAVRDEQYNVNGYPEYQHIQPLDGSDSFYARPLPVGGKFFVGFRARGGGSTPNADGVGFAIVRNGHCFPIARWEDALASSPTVTSFRPMETGGSYGGFAMREMWPLWVSAGDSIAFRIFTDTYDVPLTAMTEYMEVLDVTFYPAWATWPFNGGTLVDGYLSSGPTVPGGWTLPQLNLGATTELYSMTVEDFGSPATDLADIPGRDFVVLADGTIYAAWCEEIDIGNLESLVLKKWDGASWSTITGNLWGRGTAITTYESACVSMDVDSSETYAYIAWHERDVANNEHYWRCKRLKLSDDTLTELGPSTGTTHYTNSTRKRNAASAEQQLRLRVSPAGVPWVGWVEVPTANINPPNGPNHNSSLPFLYYWDGASWTDSGLPDPPTMRTDWWDTNTVAEPVSHIEFTFCHASGPSEYPSAVYNVEWFTPATDFREFIYWEYNGTIWGNSIQRRANLIWSGLIYNTNDGHWHQGMSLINDGSKPYLVAALGSSGSSFDWIAVCTVEDDASDFLALDSPFADAPMAILNNDGGWQPQTSEAVFSPSGVLYVLNTQVSWETPAVLGQGDAGDGTGWRIIHRPNGYQWIEAAGFGPLSPDRIRFKNGKIYAMFATPDNMLGIWVITPPLLIPMNWRSSTREGGWKRILKGNT